eukprot:1548844-Pleurochrysis_carterae.AAC.1
MSQSFDPKSCINFFPPPKASCFILTSQRARARRAGSRRSGAPSGVAPTSIAGRAVYTGVVRQFSTTQLKPIRALSKHHTLVECSAFVCVAICRTYYNEALRNRQKRVHLRVMKCRAWKVAGCGSSLLRQPSTSSTSAPGMPAAAPMSIVPAATGERLPGLPPTSSTFAYLTTYFIL